MMLGKSVCEASEEFSPSDPSRRDAVTRSILDLWACVGHEPDCAAVLGRVLMADPGLVDELHDVSTAAAYFRKTLTRGRGESSKEMWRAMTTLVLESAGRCGDLFAACRNSMPELMAACVVEPSCLVLVERFLRRRGSPDAQMLDLLLQLRSETLIAGKESGGQLELRTMALDAFVAGRLGEAERIYRHLIASGGFEPAGTRTHLARVLILTGREPEAARIIEDAWLLRGQDPAYVTGRVLYLRPPLAALAGADARPSLLMLKGIASRPETHMDWTMAPVLERIAPRLSDVQRELFSALHSVLNSGHGMDRLEAMRAWRDIDDLPAGGPRNA